MKRPRRRGWTLAWLLAGLAALAALPGGLVTHAQPIAALDVVGHVGGAPSDAAVVGDVAYVATGYALDAYDISRPEQPVLLSSLPRRGTTWDEAPQDPQRLHVVGDRGLLVDRNMVRLLDLANPSAPAEEGVYSLPETRILDAVRDGTILYVASAIDRSGVTVVDISMPSVPRELAYTNDGRYSHLVLAGGCLYAAGEAEDASSPTVPGLRVYDVTVPTAPLEMSWMEWPAPGPYDLAVAANRLYVALDGGVRMFTVADPTDPRYLGTIGTSGAVGAVAADPDGAHAWLVHGGVLEAVDVTDPGAPVRLATLEIARPDRVGEAGEAGLAAGGDTVVVTQLDAGAFVVDMSGPGAIAPAGTVADWLPGRVHHVASAGDRAIALVGRRMAEIDLTQPDRPVVTAVLPPGPDRWFTHAAVSGATLALLARTADGDLELELLDLAVRGAPRRLALVDLGSGRAEALLLDGSRALVGYVRPGGAAQAAGAWRVRVLDVADPARPTELGALDLADTRSVSDGDPAMALADGVLLLGTDVGVTIADVADPSALRAMAALRLGVPVWADAAAAAADRAYIAYRSSRAGDLDNLAAIDLTDPAAPVVLSRQAAHHAPLGLALGPRHLFGGSRVGVHAYATGGPTGLALAKTVALPAWARAIALGANLALVAADDAGLFVLSTGETGLPTRVPTVSPPATPSSLPPATPSSLPPTTTRTPSPATVTPTVTGALGSATPTTRSPSPTSAATASAGDCVCRILQRRVPPVVIADAVANPEQYQGWLQPRNPNAPVGPSNPLRTCLTLQRLSVPYHPLWNPVVWRAGCH